MKRQKHAAHLRPVPTRTEEVPNMTDPSYRLIFAFLALGAAFLALIAYFAPGNRWRWSGLETQFLTLKETYERHGLPTYQQKKATLKTTVQEVLKDGADPAQVALATNIAVFLFPGVLPETDFEKDVAQELWGDSMKKIEEHPRSPEARVLFEELRADIWNYELADREDPKLSAPAREVIQLYDTLSAP